MSPWNNWFWQLFGLTGPMKRGTYIIAGAILLPLKYFVEAATIFLLTGKSYTFLDFINPLLSSRTLFTADAPAFLGMAWILWSLPFLWLAVSFSIRRSHDAALSPWTGLAMLIPLANLPLMVGLSIVPSGCFRPIDSEAAAVRAERSSPSSASAAAIGLTWGAAYLLGMILLSVYVFGSYGAAMFFGAPVITGSVAAFTLNRHQRRSLGFTILHSTKTMAFACVGLLLLGLEGFICVAMAVPIVFPLGLFGAMIGHAIATIPEPRPGRSEQQGLLGCMFLLPLIGWIEASLSESATYEVASSIEVNAPPEDVWAGVISFPEISATPEWYFRLGIAYPTKARIEGQGVGAVRYCEFSTGEFVEPVTVWDAPRRLAFDVSEQPEPMFELSPYRHIHPPHLDGAFRSLRGEFRLVPIDANTTRLEGSTWYQLDIYPHGYWTIWTDWILHRIHDRVLEHIKHEVENPLEMAK